MMKNCFFYIKVNNSKLLSNLPTHLHSRPDLCGFGVFKSEVNGIVLFERKELVDNGFIYLCSDDKTLTKKIFGYYFDALKTFFLSFKDKISDIEISSLNSLSRLQHNVRSYNASIQDDLTDLISLEDMQQDWNNVVLYAESVIKDKPRESAITILKTYKNSSLIKAELAVFDLIEDPNPHLEIYPHAIHKVVKLSFQPYFLEFLNLGIHLQWQNCYDKVLVDYPSLSVILGHIWNNAIKYVMPQSTIDITYYSGVSYVTTEIEMISYYIETEERETIFKEGVSGCWAKRMGKDGHGIGMYYIKCLTELNSGVFTLIAGNEKKFYDGIPYACNIFRIELPRATE